MILSAEWANVAAVLISPIVGAVVVLYARNAKNETTLAIREAIDGLNLTDRYVAKETCDDRHAATKQHVADVTTGLDRRLVRVERTANGRLEG